MVLFNLYLILNRESIKVFDNSIQEIVYVGLSDHIPKDLMIELVHDVTIKHDKDNKEYFLININ